MSKLKNIYAMERGKLQAYAYLLWEISENQTALLRNLAASACDHCWEKDCEKCWARDYK